jgi:branched-chain amino acid transport system substrate-binding protein
MKTALLRSVVLLSLCAGCSAAETPPLGIGMITTLSGPTGYLGQDIRDGFQLAITLNRGMLGDVPVELVVEDDSLKPAQAKQISDRMLKNRGIRLFTGTVFSNIAAAIVPDILDAGGFYIGANAAASNYAGKDCAEGYFVIPWQNDTKNEAAGVLANTLKLDTAVILAPNYQAGRDALEGFKRTYKGKVLQEIYTRLDQLDFATELAQVRAAKPAVVFQFHPGGLGIAFARQYDQAGLRTEIPVVVGSASMDQVTVATLGKAALGTYVTSHWNSDFDNPANKRFVTEWTKAYGRPVSVYASQGYEAALAIDAALKQTKGRIDDTAAFRHAMLKADFQSTRGNFRFGNNQHPIQDWYELRVEDGPNGVPTLQTKERILTNYGDAYAAQCKLQP